MILGGVKIFEDRFGTQFPEFRINDLVIDQEEYEYAVRHMRHKTVRYFMDSYQVDVNELSWEKEVHGEIPTEKLMNLAIEYLMEQKNVYLFAAQNGYIQSAGGNDIRNRMEEENKRRKQKKENGEIVYGLLEFSYESYLTYEMDSFEKRYCADQDATKEEYDDLLQKRYQELDVSVDKAVLYDFTAQLSV